VNNRRFRGKNLHQWVKSLPIGHLHLGRQALPERESSSTIGEMIDAVECGALRHSSPTGARRIDRTLNALLRTLGDGRPDNWDRFRKARPPLRSYKAIYFASPRLRALNARERKLALAKAHLSRRAINALEKARITTIGQLIKRAERGIINLAGLGLFKGLEVIASLDALADAVRKDGWIDWLKFAQFRKFAVLPRNAIAATPADFIRKFPRVCEAAIATTFNKNAVGVLKTHLLRGASAYNARTKTGKLLSLNREMIRLYENEIVDALRGAIWDEDYCGCQFRFRREFVAPLLELRECLLQKASPNLRSSWVAALQESWGVDPEAVSNQEVLLLRLLRRDAPSFQQESWVFGRVHAEICQFVRRNRTRPIAGRQVWQHVTRKLGRLAATPKEVLTILDSLPNLERGADKDSFVVSLKELSYTDRCEVILRARGAPMHFRDLHSAIAADSSKRSRRKIKLTGALLSASRRFVSVGWTGYWALREWRDVETRTIPDIAAELLEASPRPLRGIELYRLIKVRRRIGYNSIGCLLGCDKRFKKVARGTWALKKKRA
jgi:Bacterial RNA polymerase, alpha chain C terminal domain